MARSAKALLALALLASGFACGGSEPKVESFEITGRPSAVALLDDRVFVADDERHDVHVLDPDGDEVRSISVAENPVAMDAGRGQVFVAHGGGEISVIADGDVKEYSIGGSLTDVVAYEGGAFVTDIEDSSLLGFYDGKVDRRRNVERGAIRLAVGKQHHLWITNSEDTVEVPLEGFVEVGAGPIGITFDGDSMWVANSDDGTVSRIDEKSAEVVGEPIEVGQGPIELAALAGSIWVINQDDKTVSRIDEKSGEVIGKPIPLETTPRGIAAGDGSVWVVGVNPSLVVRVTP